MKLTMKILYWSITTAVMVGISLGLVIMPAQTELVAKQNDIHNAMLQTQKINQSSQSTLQAKKQLAQITDSVQHLQQVYVDKNDPLIFLTKLKTIAATHQVTVEIATTDTANTTTTGVTPVTLTLTITGNLSNTLNYINALLINPVYINIQTLTLSPSQNQPETVQAILTATTYWQ